MWRVVVGAEEGPWVDPAAVPIDPPSGWIEAPDDIVPGYQQERFETEGEANAAARWLRSCGFSAATELVDDEPAGAQAS